MMPRIAHYLAQRFKIAGIGQLVDIDNLKVGFLYQETHQSGADKARSAGNQNFGRIENAQLCETLLVAICWKLIDPVEPTILLVIMPYRINTRMKLRPHFGLPCR